MIVEFEILLKVELSATPKGDNSHRITATRDIDKSVRDFLTS